MKNLLLFIGLILLSDCENPATMKSEKPKAPNIIYVLADDLGYGDLGVYGQKHFKTPNVDRLATGGMRFLQHYSGSTVCAPSRSALMTGQHTCLLYTSDAADE